MDALTRGLFDPPVLSLSSALVADAAALHPEERRWCERFAPHRRRELATGRRCARRLLGRLEVDADAPLLRGPSGAPTWPAGATGSISHAEGVCVAAVARTTEIAAVGVDVERAGRVESRLWRRVCTPGERAWLARRPASEQAAWATVLFSAKESVYKAMPSTLQASLRWQAVEVRVAAGSRSQGGFAATWAADGAPLVGGRFLRRGGWVVTGVAIPAQGSRIARRRRHTSSQAAAAGPRWPASR